MEVSQIAELLTQTLSPVGDVVHSATEALDRLSLLPHFPFSLLFISAGGADQGQRVAAATYLKNYARRNIEGGDGSQSKASKEFKDQLMRTLLQSEPAVLKVLVETFRIIAVAEFVKQNSWPELVPELRHVIENSNVISNDSNSVWNTVNSLVVLHSLVRPFQYFLNPKIANEPVPPQLEQIAKELLVPLLEFFNYLVDKALAIQSGVDVETEKILLMICKCLYFAVRSYMPSALVPLLPSFCHSVIRVLGCLSLNCGPTSDDGYLLRLKTGKRALLIFSVLVTRHRKHSDRLMPDIIKCVLKIVSCSSSIAKLDFLPERIVSLAFDVVSRVLETGPGWRLVSPHFSFLLDSAIFPALSMNEKDVSEWEEDVDEYIRKNLPSELEEISAWREDLFTARKSALNLLGVIAMSKGPPIGNSSSNSLASTKRKKGEKNKSKDRRNSMGELSVLPFLSKFPLPSNAKASDAKISNDYYGVLMAYGGLQDFLTEQKPGYIATLLRSRVLPLYSVPPCTPYLIAAANWVFGELASCLPEEMIGDVYSSLLKALAMPDKDDISCYPVRVSAGGAIAGLLENDYFPPQWLPLIQVVISMDGKEDEENTILFHLLKSIVETENENVAIHIPYIVSSLVDVISKFIHPTLELWPQVVIQGFEVLAVIAKSWESLIVGKDGRNICKALSTLLQQAWLLQPSDEEGSDSPPPSCIDNSSTLLSLIIQSVTEKNDLLDLKLPELLLVWADLIADWDAWEESEDMSIFDCIKDVLSLQSKYGLTNFIARQVPSPPAPPVPERSIVESIGAFVSEAVLQYPSATWRACSCVHFLLHVPSYSFKTEDVKKSLAISFCQAAFSRFRGVQSKPCPMGKHLSLVIASCYLCFPDTVEAILNKEENGGFMVWASFLASACTNSSEHVALQKSEIKLQVMTLAKVVERLMEVGNPNGGLLQECFTSLIDTSIQLKEAADEMEDEENDSEAGDDENDDSWEDIQDDDDDDGDEDSESDELEETEQEFLERYAEAASALENCTLVEEGDAEDQDDEIELGSLEVDEQKILLSLISRYHNVLSQEHSLPPQLVTRFLNAFPECRLFFQQSMGGNV